MRSGRIKTTYARKRLASGSIYINVPSPLTGGNLVVCVREDNVDVLEKEDINIQTGSLCLFPASLYHYTIPFESNDERIVLAFDVIPTGNHGYN